MSELTVAEVTAQDVEKPSRWIVFLHGILGSGANWRTFARRLVAAKPEWGALLVDLRLHGESRDFSPPHTLSSAARDMVDAMRTGAMPADVHAVLGHSFGGKVGIELAAQLSAQAHVLDHLFVIDSTPSARPDHRGSSGVREIVELLTQLPSEFSDRNAFTAWAEERGVSRPTAMWLAMNVRPVPNTTRFEFRIDIPAVRGMMDDYFLQDLWSTLEHPPHDEKRTMHTHLIAGGKSRVLDATDLERSRALSHCTVHVIEDAGHWVHVDAPDALFDIVLRAL